MAADVGVGRYQRVDSPYLDSFKDPWEIGPARLWRHCETSSFDRSGSEPNCGDSAGSGCNYGLDLRLQISVSPTPCNVRLRSGELERARCARTEPESCRGGDTRVQVGPSRSHVTGLQRPIVRLPLIAFLESRRLHHSLQGTVLRFDSGWMAA